MMKRFSQVFAYLLLVLMPIQTLAAANMLVCNNMVNTNKAEQFASEMPCHQPMEIVDSNADESEDVSCKAQCASLCAAIGAAVLMPASVQSNLKFSNSHMIDFNHKNYASIIQENPQRPPISLI